MQRNDLARSPEQADLNLSSRVCYLRCMVINWQADACATYPHWTLRPSRQLPLCLFQLDQSMTSPHSQPAVDGK